MLITNPDPGFDVETLAQELMAKHSPALLSLVFGLHEEEETEKYSRLVRKMKSLFDTLIVAQLPLSSSRRLVEKAFTAGFHAIIFTTVDSDCKKLNSPAATLAVEIFAPGAVFLSFNGTVTDKNIKDAISLGFVPLCDMVWEQVDTFLMRQGLERRWLHFLGFYSIQQPLGMKDKIARKYLLELTNLKHSLRVSRVEESYQSSSL